MYESIKSNLVKAADVSKNYFDKKAHKRNINVNDLVLLTNMGKANKIQPDFIGPFIVTDTTHLDENTINTLDTPSQPQVVSTLRLRPFIPPVAKDTLVSEAGRPTRPIHTSPST
uniref:Uncharacterized protein n=1 Tax=Romanomermis culicivorax TaxID=13658 RepID=A0A915IAC2_ROMCU